MTSHWEALVVGINYYPSHTTLQPLTAAANDAETIAVQLEQYGFQAFRVQRLPRKANQKGEWQIDADAGVVRIKELREAIGNLLNPPDLHPPETALFFFSGHGWRKTVNDKEEVFLATSDVLPSGGDYGLSLSELGSLMQTSPVKNLIIWLDCCYSGKSIEYLPTNKDYCIFTATRSYEPGVEIEHQEGLFTQALTAGLNPDLYPDGMVDSHKLAKYIQQRMQQSGQSPQCVNSPRSILLTSKVTRKAFKDECPYRSLAYFTEQSIDAQVFYGRTKLTQDLIARVSNKDRLIAVFGSSGSGKSSLIRAGLLYRLKLGQAIAGSNNWVYVEPFTPTDDPVAKLLAAVGIEIPVAPAATTKKKTTKKTARTRPNRAKALVPTTNLAALITANWPPQTPIVLIVDQFEECFTMSGEAQRQAFIDCLTELIDTTPNLQLIIGMRSDFRGRLREYPQFARMTSKVNVGHLNREEIQEAIEKPAEFVGLGIEGSLKQQLIVDVEDYPGSLPLLQYTLTELWQEARKQGERFLRLATYQGLGGIEGTLEKRADVVYESLLPEERIVAKRIFLELTQVGDTLDTRRRVKLGDLVNSHHSLAMLEQVTQKLANQENRLITRTGADSAEDANVSNIMIDVVHEALVRHWKQLGNWKRQYQAAMLVERKIEAAAQEWEENGKKSEYLLQESRLGEAEEYVRAFNELGMLDGMAEEFIDRSIDLRRRNRWIRGGIIGGFLGVVAVGAIGSAFFAFDANREKTIAQLKEQAANIRVQLPLAKNVSPLILALKIAGENQAINENWILSMGRWFKPEPNLIGEVQGSLDDAIEIVRERNIFKGHQDAVRAVALSADGRTIVSGGKDGSVRLWDLSGNQIGTLFQGQQDAVRAVAFSADGRTIVSGGQDGTVRLWNRAGQPIGSPFQGHQGDVAAVAVSADGRTIVSGGQDGTVRLWDRAGQPIGSPFQGHKQAVLSIALSADGGTIVSGGQDGSMMLWKRAGNQIGSTFLGHLGVARSVAVSADGRTIVGGGQDGTVRLWDRAGNQIGRRASQNSTTNPPAVRSDRRSGQQIGSPFKGHQGDVYAIALSADGRTIVSGGQDGTVRLWDRSGQQIGSPWKGHQHTVLSIALSADGRTIVSGGQDGTVRLWDRSGKQIGSPWKGHQHAVFAVALSAVDRTIVSDDRTIVSGGQDGTVRLWDRSGQPIGSPWKGHQGDVAAVAISAGGRTIVSGGRDGTVRLWDRSGQPIGSPFQGHKHAVLSIALSADGRTIVSGGQDGTVRLWDRAEQAGNPLDLTLRGHRGAVNAVAVSANGQTIVSGGEDGTVRLWDRAGKQIGSPLPGHRRNVRAVAVSADGQTIVSGGQDGTVRLWDRAGQPIGSPVKGHLGVVRSVAVSADGHRIVSGGQDGTVRLWDRAGQPISLFQGHLGAVRSVAVSSDGHRIVSGGQDGTVRLWRGVVWQDWLAVGCDRLRRHPDFTSAPAKDAPEEGKTLAAAVQTCVNYGSWTDPQTAEFFVRQGLGLAQQDGDLEGATAKFKRAQQLDASVNVAKLAANAEKLAATLVARKLIDDSKKLAADGDLAGATAKFKQAQQLDASVNVAKLTTEINRLAAANWIEQGKNQVREGKVTAALALYDRAKKLDPTLKIGAAAWNYLCYQGSIYGQASDVMFACEKAVKLAAAGEKGNYQESRGLAKALSGDKQGAIADFQAYIDDRQSDPAYKDQHKKWIAAIEKGEDPFTAQVLQQIKSH
jgi:WD40 repeat protein